MALIALAAALSPPIPARANFTSAQLAAIAASPPPNAALPPGLVFQDETGNAVTAKGAIGSVPALVIFADYTCRTLCGPILDFTLTGLTKSALRPGVDYRLLVIGLDPKDSLEAARTMRAQHIEPSNPISQTALFLTGSESTIRAASTSLGLHYAYDAEHDQYAHPAALYVLDAKGRVQRVLSPLGLDGNDLRLAVIDAGRGAVGSLTDRIHLLCYGYDPVAGVYTERITTMLGYAAALTLIVLLGGVAVMIGRERRSAAS
jgi:protein SCO1/2